MNKLSNTEKLELVKVSSIYTTAGLLGLTVPTVLGTGIGIGTGLFGPREHTYHDGPYNKFPIVEPTTLEEAQAAFRNPEQRRRKLLRNTMQGAGIPLGAILGGNIGASIGSAIGGDDIGRRALLEAALGIPGAIVGGYGGWKLPRMLLPLAIDHDKVVYKNEKARRMQPKKDTDKKDDN